MKYSKMTHDSFGSAALLVLALAVSASGCISQKGDEPIAARQSAITKPGGGGGDEEDSRLGVASVRTFNQLYESMATATGVDGNTTQCKNAFNDARTRLSLDGSAEAVTPAMMLATTTLASCFCRNAVTREAALGMNDPGRILFAGLNLGGNQSLLTPSVRNAVFQSFAERFWRREATSSELEILSTAVDEALAGQTSNSTQLRNALHISCTAALNSLDFIKS